LPKTHLTAAAVARIKAPPAGQIDHFDAGYPGLALRISYGGRRTWVWFYREEGKLRRATLGQALKGSQTTAEPGALDLVGAREAWRAARERLKKGLEPVPAITETSREDGVGTVSKVIEDWLKRDQEMNRKYRTPARSYGEVKRIMHREVTPLWGKMQVGDVTAAHVEKLLNGITDRGKVTQACRVYARLHRFFRWAAQKRIIDASPMANMARPAADVKRKRVLKDHELCIVWKAAQEIGWPMGSAIQLLILTCARKTEIGALRWDEIDEEGNEICLEGDRTKNAEDRIIPLSAMARSIIDAVPRLTDSPFVFSTTTTTPISGWSKVKERIDGLMRAELGKKFEAWRLHDLRRTAATGLERLGVPLQVTEALLGHTAGSKAGIAGVYQLHDYAAEKRDAVEKWARHVATVVRRAK
jgi:integrase